MKILAISGSLRASSYNTALLENMADLAPDGVEIEIYDISEVPLYNDDLSDVPAVDRFKEAIVAADAVLLATPEYNYSLSGVLKNALDWASRPAYSSPMTGKKVAIVGASMSTVGTARAQGHLKQILLGMASEVFPFPEVLVARAHTRFDDEQRLNDEDTRALLEKMLRGFADWVQRGG